MKRVAEIYRALGLLVCLSIAALVVGATLHHFSTLPSPYTWYTPLRTLRLIVQVEWFPTTVAAVYLVGFSRRGDFGTLAERIGQQVDVRAFVRGTRRPLTFAVPLAVADALLFSNHNIVDVGAVFALGAVLGHRRLRRKEWFELLGHVGLAAVAFSCVCYFYTVVKALTFVGRTPADALVSGVEQRIFGFYPHRVIATWASTRPAFVELCDWVYFNFFQHMTLTTVLLMGMAQKRLRSEYLAALALCYLIGGPLYHVLPAMGPGYFEPEYYGYLESQPLLVNEIRAWLFNNTAGIVQTKADKLQTWSYLACMPSLHIAHELVMLYYARRSTIALAIASIFAAITSIAVVVLGWHYVIDSVGGLIVAAAAITIAKWQRDRLMPSPLSSVEDAPLAPRPLAVLRRVVGAVAQTPPEEPVETTAVPDGAAPVIDAAAAPAIAARATALPMDPLQKVVLLVSGIAFLVFLPSIFTGLVFDDTLLISQNEYVHAWRWLPRAFSTHFWDITRSFDASEVRRYYRPLVTVSYLVTWMLVGARPWVFHLTNVLLHALTAGLATRAAWRWTASRFCAAAIGLAFALHPTRTENVTWVSGRTDVLMTLFVLLALEAFAAFERLRTSAPARARGAFAAGVISAACALLSKEPAVMLPLLLLAEHTVSAIGTRRSRLPIIVTAAMSSVYIAWRTLLFPIEVNVVRTLTPLHSLLTIGAYIQRVIVPWPPTMYYQALTHDDAGPVYPLPLVLLGVVLVTAASAGLVLAWRRSRAAFWLFVAAIGFMGPLLNVYFTGVNVSAQDRFLYAPLLFGLGGLVLLFRDRIVRLSQERMASLVVVAFGLAWTLIIQIRTPDYRNDQTLWEAELEHNASHPYVLQMLAQGAARRGDLATSYEFFQRAEAPDARKYQLTRVPGAHFQQAVVLAAILPDGRAMELRLLLEELWRLIDPTTTLARATVHGFEIGAPVGDLEQVSRDGRLYWDIALLATRLGDFARAEEAIRRSPGAVLASANPLNGALALARMGRFADARGVWSEIRERPEELGALVSSGDLASFDERLRRAERIAEERDHAPSEATRSGTEAMLLAELGAYLAALRKLDADGTIDLPEATPLVLQLLMACRLEEAARQRARHDLGAEEGEAAIAQLRAELPSRLREMPAVKGDLKTVLAGGP